jgi:cellulase/cellobiase CelA1
VVNNQWGNGFTASIRVKNISTAPINGWNVNWQYADGSKVTGSWNVALSGSNPYAGKNVSWNANIQPGQTAEFGFQGSKPTGTASVPVVTGPLCK